jgi:hypothetical protein
MPVISTVFDGGYSGRWYHLFTSELRSIKRFEVVNADPEVLLVQQCLEQAKQGLYPEATLAALAQHYRVDGAIFIRMDNFDPYWPPRMALNVNLVETFNGEAIAAVDGNWDARDKHIEVLIHDYAEQVTTSQEMANPELFMQSPEYFGKYVAHDVALALCNLFRDERGLPRPPEIGPVETVSAIQEVPSASSSLMKDSDLVTEPMVGSPSHSPLRPVPQRPAAPLGGHFDAAPRVLESPPIQREVPEPSLELEELPLPVPSPIQLPSIGHR